MSEHECPNPHCGNSGAYPVEPDGDAEQCEWCHTVPESVFNLKGRITQLERELADFKREVARAVWVKNTKGEWEVSSTGLEYRLRQSNITPPEKGSDV